LRKALGIAGVLLLAVIAAAAVLLWYIRPAETLDLSYRDISIVEKVTEMVRKRELVVELDDDELSNLVKRAIAEKPQLTEDVRITGVRVETENGLLALHVNAVAKGFVKAGATIYAKLEWREPNLLLTLDRGAVKKLEIPGKYFSQQNFIVPLYDKLPALVGIKDIRLEDGKLRIMLKLLR